MSKALQADALDGGVQFTERLSHTVNTHGPITGETGKLQVRLFKSCYASCEGAMAHPLASRLMPGAWSEALILQ